jgi:glucose-6-phosphate 1-dehydrogenase
VNERILSPEPATIAIFGASGDLTQRKLMPALHSLRFQAKEPGAGMRTRPVDMEFHYTEHFGDSALPDAYERLLLDAMQADASLFARADEIELAWGLVDPILDGWARPDAPPVAFYEPGSWGPAEADDLLAQDGRTWHYGCGTHGDD